MTMVSEEDVGLGEGLRQTLHEPAQHTEQTRRSVDVAGSQHGSDEELFRLLVEADEAHQRQVAPTAVVAVEEAHLLASVRGVIGRVEVDRDATGLAVKTAAVPLDDDIGESLCHVIQLTGSHGVLEARHRHPLGLGQQHLVEGSSASLAASLVSGQPQAMA